MRDEKKSGRTVVQQLHEDIMAHLRDSGSVAGDKIPTEAELCETFSASRPTVREALKLLEQDGAIRVVHGRGRYLTAAGTLHVERPITTFESITDMAGHIGYKLENIVLSVQEDEPSKIIRDALQLDADQPIIRLERLRLLDREPIVYCLDYVRRDVITDRLFDLDWSGSLLDVLGGYQARPSIATAVVRAEMLPEEVIRRHGLQDFGVALTIEETTYTDNGMPVAYAVDYHKGTHFSFSFMRK